MTRIRRTRGARALGAATAIGVSLAAAGPAVATHTIAPGYTPSHLNPNYTTMYWGMPGADAFASNSTGTSCSGGTRPGTTSVVAYLKYHWGDRLTGTYNCRTVSGSSSLSLHAEGRALDYHVNKNVAAEKAIGDAIFNFFRKTDSGGVALAPMRRFGIQEVIWNCRTYSASNTTIRTYFQCANGSTSATLRHEDHIHIGLNRAGAERQRTAWAGYKPCWDRHNGCPF